MASRKQPFLGKHREPQLSAGINGTTDPEKSCRYLQLDMLIQAFRDFPSPYSLRNCLRLQAKGGIPSSSDSNKTP